MFYRIRQFYEALFPKISETEYTWVYQILPSSAKELFARQSLVEQRHSIDVAKDILANSSNLSESDLSKILIASLLHDCGKSIIQIKLWHRVIGVILLKLPLRIQGTFITRINLFKIPFVLSKLHPRWGEKLAKQVGLEKDIQLLIREHHEPKSRLGILLHLSDNRN